jgi:hypothetical protein
MRQNLLKNVKFVRAMNAVAANSNGTQTSSTVDAAGFDSVTAIVDLAAVTDNATVVVRVLDGALSNGADAANVASASATLTASTSSNTQIIVDCQRPLARYVTFKVDQAVGNSAIACGSFLLSNPSNRPVTQPSSVSASTTVAANS